MMYDQPNDLYAAILAKLSALEAQVRWLEEELLTRLNLVEDRMDALDEDDNQ